MKVKPRATATINIAKRITAPEAARDATSGKKIAMLGYIDEGSYQRHVPATKDLFLYAAGTNEAGEIPDGLDRLLHHQYVVHLNKGGKAIGLDVIPKRLYRSGVTPKSAEGVKTLIIQYDLDGAVARVIQRPFNVRFEQSHAVIRELDKLISAGKSITTSVKLGQYGRVVNTTDNTVEVRLNATSGQKAQAPSRDSFDQDDIHEAPDAEDTAPARRG